MTTKKSAPKKEVSKKVEIIPEKEVKIPEGEVKLPDSVYDDPEGKVKENNPDWNPKQDITPTDEEQARVDEVNNKPIVLLIMSNEKLFSFAADRIVEHYDGELAAIPANLGFKDKTLVEKIVDFISTWENEEIILMNGIIPVNKFTRGDVEAVYAILSQGKFNYTVHTPVLLERSKIVELLEETPEIDDKDFVPAYIKKFHGDKLPLLMDWKTDTFTLPIVSLQPSHATLTNALSNKRWFWVSDKSMPAVIDFFGIGED